MPLDRKKNRRKANAATGGSSEPMARGYVNGRYVGSDDRAKSSLARCYGQDLMRGEHVVGETASNRGAMQQGTTIHPYDGGASAETQSGTSIFDPVLCELSYRWFCPAGGSILDPFAGGSVRGIVAAQLGFTYTGIDLSARQIAANEAQAETICGELKPRWIVGDSQNVATLAPGAYDFVFSCPPYGDLEVYSEDAADLSTMAHAEFVAAYRRIIAAAVGMLAPDRFACFVVGDFRDGKGFYRNFVADTIAAFQDAGATLYNEAILVTSVGSLPIRVGRQFEAGRKLGKTHQNILVFFKGDPKAIKAWPLPDFGEPETDLSPSPELPGTSCHE